MSKWALDIHFIRSIRTVWLTSILLRFSVPLSKLTVPRKVKKFSAFYASKVFITVCTTVLPGPYYEPHESSPHHQILFLQGISLTLREEHRLRVFENRVLGRIFGSKRDGVTGEWRKLHNEELNDLYCSPNIVRVIKSRRMRWAGHVTRVKEGRGVHKVLVGKPEGKRTLGRPRRRWEDNIKMDLEEVGRGCGDWMELAQGRDRWRALVSTVMNFRVP